MTGTITHTVTANQLEAHFDVTTDVTTGYLPGYIGCSMEIKDSTGTFIGGLTQVTNWNGSAIAYSTHTPGTLKATLAVPGLLPGTYSVHSQCQDAKSDGSPISTYVDKTDTLTVQAPTTTTPNSLFGS